MLTCFCNALGGVAELKATPFSQGEIAIRALLALLCFFYSTQSLPPTFPSLYGIILVLINEGYLKYVGLKVLGGNAYSQSRTCSGEHLNLCMYTSYFDFEFYIFHKKYSVL